MDTPVLNQMGLQPQVNVKYLCDNYLPKYWGDLSSNIVTVNFSLLQKKKKSLIIFELELKSNQYLGR